MIDPETPYVAEQSILHLVGAQSAQRGKAYARSGAASVVEWEHSAADGDRGTLIGTVVGTQPRPYTTVVDLKAGATARSLGVTAWEPYRATCTCPVGRECKHAAALLYAATTLAMRERLSRASRTTSPGAYGSEDPDGPAGSGHRAGRPAASPASWREMLQPLVHGTSSPTSTEPLAFGVELRTEFGGFGFSRFGAQPASIGDVRTGTPLHASLRVLRRGTRENWIKGGLSWKKFQYANPLAVIRQDHADLVARLVRLHLAESSYGVDPGELLRLDSFRSADAWSLLAEARRVGIAFVGQGVLGRVEWTDPVTAGLDVQRTADGLRLSTATLTADGEARADLRPAGAGGFLSVRLDEGHPERARLLLAPAAAPVPEALRALFRSRESLIIPEAEAQDFLEDYTPQLRGTVTLTSGDGSVQFPEPSPARLQLEVRYAPEDRVELAWSWLYRGPRRTLPLLDALAPASRTAGRDVDHELSVLQEVRTFWGPAGHRAAQQLDGVEAASFVEHTLPRVATLADVDVIEHGTRPGYTELTGTPRLRITQVEPPHPDRTDWFDIGFEVTIGEHLVPFTAIFAALSQGRKSVLLPDKSYAKLDHPMFEKLRELLAEAEAMEEWEARSPRVHRHQVSFWEDFEDLAEQSEQAVAWRESVGALRELDDLPSPEPPAGLRATLRPYQREGYAWLSFLHQHRLGGILADDMGLGKTVQTLALVQRAREAAADSPPFLVVAPSSVLSVWRAEAERFTPDLDLRVLDTTAARRGSTVAVAAAGADLIITSYTLLRIDEEQFTTLDWDGLVLDEAQFVKNHASKGHRAAAALRAPFRLAVTGTPMENSLTDLWSLLSLTAPGLFPSIRRFREEYVRPIEKPDPSESGARRAEERMARLRRRVRPFLLRRTKDLVAPELPEKQEQVVHVPLQSRHRALYDRVLQRERQKLLDLVEDLDRNRFIVFRSLTLLRMLALDPAIVDQAHAQVPSSKLESLMEKLEEVLTEGHRVIVFSQFTSFLARVAQRLEERGIGFAYLDGSTRDRAGAIASFREGQLPLFLISLKAGGFGLTLTEADYVFLLDPWWNPAAEAQAVDRAHRIGQDRTVMVYRMVAEGTIEEKVLALQERKAALFSSLTDGESAFQSSLSAEDVRELLRD